MTGKRLRKVQQVLEDKMMPYSYHEEDGCGSIDFTYRGVNYHIWEFADGEEPCGAETNIYNAGRSRDLEGDYEEAIIKELIHTFI